MGDKARIIDSQIQIVGTDPATPVTVELDPDSDYAAKVRGYVTIEGSSGAQATLSKANKMETNVVDPSANGWNTVLDLTVPSGYTWYLKGMMVGTSRSCSFRLVVGGTTKNNGNLDATDSFDVPLYGFEVVENTTVQIQMNTSANQSLSANIIIYEEANG